MQDDKSTNSFIPRLNTSSTTEIKENIHIPKPLKRRGAQLVPTRPKELVLEETIKLPIFSQDTPIDDGTVELPILLTPATQTDSEQFAIKQSESPLPVIEPMSEETIELPLFKESTNNFLQNREIKNTIVVESQTIKKKNKLLKRCIESLVFLVAIMMTVFGAYKIIIWQKENIIIDREMNRIQNLIEERVVTPPKQGQTEQDNSFNPSESSNPNESTDSPYEQPPNNHDTQNNFTDFINPDTKNEIDDGLSFIDVDITRLQTINPDTNAYIKIDNLDVNYPVVQTTDNSYYLSHSFDKKYTSAGWIFGDYRNNWNNLNDNTIIYGHNRRNYAMFGSLKKMYNKDWYENEDNHLIYISTENKNMIFKIFSVYDIPTETYYLTNNFKSKLEYQNFLNTIKNRSTLEFDTVPTIDDKILTLSTCSGSKNKTVIHAILIKSQNK